MELDLGLAGLAILRAFPWGGQERFVRELVEKAAAQDWFSIELDLHEFDVEAGYARWSESYDSAPNPVIDLEQPAVRELIDQVPQGVAVDAACGTGRHAAYLAQRGHRVTAIDASEAMLARARERVPSADVRQGSLLQLSLDDQIADLVVCALALTHFEDLSVPVKELGRILKPGGHLIISDVHPLSVALSAHAFFRTPDGTRAVIKNHVHWPSEYIDAFNAAGLRVVGCMEPAVTQASIETMQPPEPVKHWAEAALIGLPFVVIWDLARV
jgi:ubiquinone/menaquinone biosynthesis C-methylase UbiE